MLNSFQRVLGKALTSVWCFALLVLVTSCAEPALPTQEPAAFSFSGEQLFSPEPSGELVAIYNEKKAAYELDKTDLENLIWYGRFEAYMGNYAAAIEVYSKGISINPNDARLYRHRGHRYITIRQLDNAIEDFEMAARLIEGQPNQVEPDGMPNAQNIPVSTLHGNIWYHLGLAYYLKHDLNNALRGFSNGLATSNNDDNVVSTTHWIYMINRLLGDEEAATQSLERISDDMNIIENFAYHQLDLFYKGELTEEELQGDGPSGDAISYGIANWYRYTGDVETAKLKMNEIIATSSWPSFGYIAAESDLHKGF